MTVDAAGALRPGTADLVAGRDLAETFVRFAGARLSGIGLAESKGEARIAVFNPFRFDVALRGVRYELVVRRPRGRPRQPAGPPRPPGARERDRPAAHRLERRGDRGRGEGGGVGRTALGPPDGAARRQARDGRREDPARGSGTIEVMK